MIKKKMSTCKRSSHEQQDPGSEKRSGGRHAGGQCFGDRTCRHHDTGPSIPGMVVRFVRVATECARFRQDAVDISPEQSAWATRESIPGMGRRYAPVAIAESVEDQCAG